MKLELRSLDGRDNAALLALSNDVGTSGGAFRVSREPDYFALGRALGKSWYVGAFAGRELVGAIGVAEQRRFIAGEETLVDYVHDLRVAPSHRGAIVVRRLSEAVRARSERRQGWAFGTIMDANDGASRLRSGGRLLGPTRVLGRTHHVGIPLSRGKETKRGGAPVVQVSPEAAWGAYERLARPIDFAPADRERFDASDGEFLAVEGQGRILAVAKVVDQSPLRRITTGDREHRIGYLAFRAAEPQVADLDAFVARLCESGADRFSHVFLGLSDREAASLSGDGLVRLSSTTVGFGDVPPDVSLRFHELTII